MDRPLPWQKYLDADELEDDDIKFDGTKVESPTGEHLGDVKGFIVDSDTGRPYYIVVDAGGWFKSKHFLLPVGHADFDPARQVLLADLTKERVKHFPGFDLDKFDKMTEDDLRRLNEETCRACSVEVVTIEPSPTAPYTSVFDLPDYRYPDWWKAQPTRPNRTGEAGYTAGAQMDMAHDKPASQTR